MDIHPLNSAVPVNPTAELDRLGDEIAELSAHLEAATARLLDLIREFDARGGWGNGFRSCAHWLSWRIGLDPGAAREKVRVARALGALPLLAAALARGELSYAKVRALTRIATPATEERLLNVGRAGTAEHVEAIVRGWRRVDRKAEAQESARQHASRALSVQHLSLIETLDAHIATLDTRIEAAMAPFTAELALIQTMPGVAKRAGEAILAETGVDMTQFPTAGHFASWARLCPGNHQSAGTRCNATTGKGATWLRATLQEAAWAAARSKKSYYRSLYHRIKGRRGAKKAIVAVQHAMLVALWHMLKHRVAHHDLGVDYFDRRNTDRVRRHHVRRLEHLGYDVVLVEKVA